MVQLLLRLTAPPGRLQQTLVALRAVELPVRLTRWKVRTHLSQETENNHVLNYVEEWADVEELNEQIQSPRFAQLLALMETAAEAPSLQFLFVSEIRGLDYVAQVRGESLPGIGG